MKKLLILVLLVMAMSLGSVCLSFADIINGDFSAGLFGWTTAHIPADGIPVTPSPFVTVEGGQAVLSTQGLESNVALISLYQTFEIPSLALNLSFDIGVWRVSADTGGSGDSFPDFLQATYLDLNNFIFDRMFVGLDVNGPYDPNTLGPLALTDLGSGMYRFTTDIAGLAGQSGTLYFDLSDQDDAFYSVARVDNVRIDVIPEPGTLLLLGTGLAGLISMGRKKFKKI